VLSADISAVLGLRRGAFTCVGWQVTLDDLIWQMTSRSSGTGFDLLRAICSFNPFWTRKRVPKRYQRCCCCCACSCGCCCQIFNVLRLCRFSTFKLHCDLETVVRGHSRSSKVALLDIAHRTLYSSTIILYTVSKKTGPLGYSQIFPTNLDQYQ